MSRKGMVLSIVVACSALLLTLGCQQAAAPQPTPKGGETGAAPKATATAPAKAAGGPVKGGILKDRTEVEIDTLDPHTTSGGGNRPPLYVIYDSLVAYNPKLQATKEGLAVDWEPAKDGLSMLVKLRKGVKFHDGTDFNAQAVKFNIERVQDPNTKSPMRAYPEPISSVEVVDEHTIRLYLKSPSPALMETFGLVHGLMVSPAAVKKYGQDYGRNPVGTGPFQFVSWVGGSKVVVKRFDGYWRKDQEGNQLPYLDGIEFTIITDVTIALANLRTGAIDMVARGLAMAEVPTIKQIPGLTLLENDGSSNSGVFLNNSKPPFDNKTLRQAVAYAVDAQAVAAAYGEGGARAFQNYILPVSWAYDPNYKFPYAGPDLAKAKAKLAEAGYPQGLKVEFLSGSGRQDVVVAEVFQDMLAKVGITADISVMAFVEQYSRYDTWQYSMGSGGNTNYADPALFLPIRFRGAGGRNRNAYNNPQFNALLDKAGSIYDEKERTALYRQAGEILLEDVGYVPTHVTKTYAGINKKVKNFVYYADGVTRLGAVWLEK